MTGQRNQHSPSRDSAYLHFIRECTCCLCERPAVDAHHPRIGLVDGDSGPGMAQRAQDRWALPLCRDHHLELHAMSEREFWASYHIDPLKLALRYQVMVQK
jgi:hypothetical protein